MTARTGRPIEAPTLAETAAMNEALKRKILDILDQHRSLTLASLRPDGWPQATTVGYASDGLTLYFLCGAESQKAHNLALDPRVSLTIDHDTNDPMSIAGLSMAALATPVHDPAEAEKFVIMLKKKYPEYMAMPEPDFRQIRIFRLTPKVISVLDYTKGFAHTDLVTL
jgi:nitroimidazol reductase NimA-like FMN-containing flavoprotein (pyridoxamine 5'-phosphate oxidase superfamily)